MAKKHSVGFFAWDLAIQMRVSPDFLNIEKEIEFVYKWNQIQKPTFEEYDRLPALWVERALLIQSETNEASSQRSG